jgi:hypothetical protein
MGRVKRLLIAALLCAASALSVNAQGGFTTITGTVTDPNGLPYDCGTISAVLVVPGGTSPSLNGVGFSGSMSPVGLGCSTTPGTGPSGSFSFRVGDNGVILPAGTQWRFTVNIAPGVVPPAGFGPRSFVVTTAINCSTNTPATCTANTIDLSTTLSGSALALSRISSGTGSLAKNVVDPTNTAFAGGAKFDAHLSAQPTFTNTSNIVTCPDCNFTGTDFLSRPIAKIGEFVFGTNGTTDVSFGTAVTITPECVIQSIDSATQIHMGVIGSPATPCNATATTAASGYIAFGDLDTAPSTATQSTLNDPLFAAATVAANNCIPLGMPGGAALAEQAVFNVQQTGQCGSAPYLTALRQGFTVFGQGAAATLVIPTPNFKASTCNPGCFLSALNMNARDFQILGLGNSTPGAGFNGKSAVYMAGASLNGGSTYDLHHLILQGWGASQTGFVGLDIGHGVANSIAGGYMVGVIVESLGDPTISFNPGISTSMNIMQDGAASVCGLQLGCLQVLNGFWSSHGNFYGWSTSVVANAINVVGSAQASFIADYFPYQTGAGVGQLSCANTASIKLIGSVINTPTVNGYGIAGGGAGCTVDIRDTIITTTTAARALFPNNSDKFFNHGNRGISGFTLGGTGKIISDPTESGTGACVASTATITFTAGPYLGNPIVTISDETTAGGARISAKSTTTATVTCTGATDAFDYTVIPNPL